MPTPLNYIVITFLSMLLAIVTITITHKFRILKLQNWLFCNNCGMSPARKKRQRRKVLVKSKKRLSMEEKTPTMPSVVFLKYLKITGESVDSQGKFAYATCDEVEQPVCPHCGSSELYAHGYYHRNASAKGRDGARKRIRIKLKRYKCRCCAKSFSQSCNRIGKWQRRNARLNDMLSRECANGVSNKAIGMKYRNQYQYSRAPAAPQPRSLT